MQNNFSFSNHISSVIQTAAQSMYAIKLLKSRGLNDECVQNVFYALVISRLIYASPAWWGFTSQSDRQALQAVIRRAIRWGFGGPADRNIEQICNANDDKLFKTVLTNSAHILHQFLPPEKTHSYDMRARAHNRQLPQKNNLTAKSFINRLLYKSIS